MSRTLLDLVRELNTLNDDNLADRVIANNDVQWCLSELQDILEAEQPTLTPPNEWVSVKERMPEAGNDMLALLECGDYAVVWWTGSVWRVRWDGSRLDRDPTVWMPLPAPPDSRPPEGISDRSKVCEMKIDLIECPSEKDWMEVKRRALVTVGLKPVNPPDRKWKQEILRARHSPIRRLIYSFYMEIPYWVSVHLCRHVHAQPYVKSQRNDRQSEYDRNGARQDETVCMIWDVNAEELQEIANKRLCKMAAKETREVVEEMCRLAEGATPELNGCLVPMCERCGGVCHEMHGGCKKVVDNKNS